MDFEQYPDSHFRHLTRSDVIEAARDVDIVAAVAEALRLHSAGHSVLPEEAYLGWTTPQGDAARLLAMPGALTEEGRAPVIGMKTINASIGNPARGIPRAQGFTLLLDPETARPRALMEAAYISAMRTAAVTALAVRHLAVAEPRGLALLGCGALAQAHIALLLRTVPTLRRITLYDVAPDRAKSVAHHIATLPAAADIETAVADGPREAVRDAEVVVPVTTVTQGYIEPDWLRPGALVCHVSLDDLTEAAVLAAGTVIVDDWSLVRDDPRRLLGRMHRAGTLLGPDGTPRQGVTARPGARPVDGTLGDVIAGRHPGRRDQDEIVVSNPFGMSILDVAVADRIHARAEAAGLGTRLTL
ncbi:ornithine cyclodeaminase family protein [Streptomyces sp. NBC_00893]|uniref:ornithine cyclodeaminase family protein n=1 Tax=Streptomyces sp. NBC_00893 TaxID=2975862 RepID=UPI0022590E21|nr:ornithine cyclodeaminase family protein [Streptomyces sp. NBC_00893]MCX4850965.1 ornithine cyclodeaminase family protein [Streptomyces sp. NBC_00893]